MFYLLQSAFKLSNTCQLTLKLLNRFAVDFVSERLTFNHEFSQLFNFVLVEGVLYIQSEMLSFHLRFYAMETFRKRIFKLTTSPSVRNLNPKLRIESTGYNTNIKIFVRAVHKCINDVTLCGRSG